MIQSKFRRNGSRNQSFIGEVSSALLPDRVPSLLQIAEQFISGRPIDQSLNRNLGYNDIECNPMLAKGVDLADIPKIAKAVGETLQDAVDAVEQAKVAKGTQAQVDNPASTPPEPVPTE